RRFLGRSRSKLLLSHLSLGGLRFGQPSRRLLFLSQLARSGFLISDFFSSRLFVLHVFGSRLRFGDPSGFNLIVSLLGGQFPRGASCLFPGLIRSPLVICD